MKKGVVMDIDEGFLTLLTPEGEFMKARKQEYPYAIGEEIHFFPIENDSLSRLRKRPSLLRKKSVWTVSIAAALLVFLGSLIPMHQDNKAYAYMSIDEKPSIELGVNKEMQVVELIGFNKDGKKIIAGLSSWRRKEVSQVTESILAEMKKEGYLKNNGAVIISTVRSQGSDAQAEKILNQNMKEIQADAAVDQVKLKLFNGTEQQREKAHKLGITTGKYYETKIEPPQLPQNTAPIGKENYSGIVTPAPVAKLPPGQQKKLTAMPQQAQKSNNQANGSAANVIHQTPGEKVPPGQLKKLNPVQTQIRQNWGQVKKKLILNNEVPQYNKVHHHNKRGK